MTPTRSMTAMLSGRFLVGLTLLLVIAAAGCGGETADPGTGGDGAAPGEASSARFVAADIVFEEAPDTVPAGSVTFELVNEGELEHNVTLEELDDRLVVEADPGATEQGSVDLEAGSYTYYCDVPGHRSAGMEGTLEVSE